MLRYVCPNCLNTFLSPLLEFHKRCDHCKRHLIHFGKPETHQIHQEIENMTDLKEKYDSLTKKSLTIGLTEDECLIIGRAYRKLDFRIRKQILLKYGWKEDHIYKHVMTKDGLLKMVIDKRAMNYESRKNAKNVKNDTT